MGIETLAVLLGGMIGIPSIGGMATGWGHHALTKEPEGSVNALYESRKLNAIRAQAAKVRAQVGQMRPARGLPPEGAPKTEPEVEEESDGTEIPKGMA